MTDDTNGPKPPYEVGYGKPPKRTRFQKGQSGNPSGRRKRKTRDPKDDFNPDRLNNALLAECEREIAVVENGKQEKVPAWMILFRLNLSQALRGDGPAARFILKHYSAMEKARLDKHWRIFGGAINTKLEYDQFRFNPAEKVTGLPDPRDLVMDPETGRVHDYTATSPKQLAERDRTLEMRNNWIAEVIDNRANREGLSADMLAWELDNEATAIRFISLLNAVLPPRLRELPPNPGPEAERLAALSFWEWEPEIERQQRERRAKQRKLKKAAAGSDTDQHRQKPTGLPDPPERC